MGTSSSRRMDDSDARSRSDDSFDPDSDLATILQYLIRSGQVHIISSDRDDSEDDFVAAAAPPKKTAKPNTENLDKSEFSILTKQSAGLIQRTGRKRPKPIVSMVCARERGLSGSISFTKSDCCKLYNTYLPSKKKVVASFQTKIFCGTYSKDGNSFLSASQDRKIRLFDTRNGNFDLIKTITARDVGWSILDTAFSPDGNYVAYSSWSESLHLCRLYGDSESQDPLLLCPDERRFCIFSLTFSSDGTEILCGANDGYIYVYDTECRQRALRIDGHDDDVNAVAFADETSQILYSGGDDGLCRVWDRRTLNESHPIPVGNLAGHLDGITFIESRGDGRHLLSNSKDQTIKLWDIRQFSSNEAIENSKKAISDQNWDYRWQRVPKSITNPKRLITGDSSLMTYSGHTVLQTLCRCHFSPKETTGQRFIYAACAAGRVIIYDVLTGKIIRKLCGHRACVRDASWHPYQQTIMSTSWDGSICRWTYNDKHHYDSDDDDSEGRYRYKTKPSRRSQRLADRRARQEERSQRNSITREF